MESLSNLPHSALQEMTELEFDCRQSDSQLDCLVELPSTKPPMDEIIFLYVRILV